MTNPEVAQTRESRTSIWAAVAAAAFGTAWPLPTAWIAAIGFVVLVLAPGFEGSDAGMWAGIIVAIPLAAAYLAGVWWAGRWLVRRAGAPRPGLVSTAAMAAPALIAAAVTPLVSRGIWDIDIWGYVGLMAASGAVTGAVAAILTRKSRGGRRQS